MSAGRKEGSTDLEIANRTRMVQEWMLQGWSSADIVRQCTHLWQIDARQAKRYISDAYDGFLEITISDLKKVRAVHIAKRDKLFRELKGKDTPQGANVAAGILNDIGKIQGIYVEKFEHNHTGKIIKFIRKQAKPQKQLGG